jgi:thiol-disulfide isomerase/thioredoxin
MKTIMKSLCLAALLVLPATAFAQGGAYTIDGQLAGADGKKVYLRYGEGETFVADSTIVSNGRFTFKGTIDRPYYVAMLYMGDIRDYQNRRFAQFSLEPAAITFTGDYDNFGKATILGGKTQTEANSLKAALADVDAQLAKLNESYDKAQTAEEREQLKEQMAPYSEQRKKAQADFYRTHPDSYLSPQYLRYDMGHMTYQELKQVYEAFTADVKKYADVKDIEKELATLANVQPGCMAPDFTAKDINGNDFTMSSLKGKVVIIDFWASWCKPCRASNPHMLELYKKYHDRGLDMVYVSDDDTHPEKWHDAVEKDQLVGDGFHHVLRGVKWDRSKGIAGIDHSNDISDKYAIHYLPTKYLIDREGRIVSKIGDNENLEEMLENLLK